MKLLSAIAFVASLSSVASVSISRADAGDYKHARVVPGVLPADSVAKLLHGHVGTLRLLRGTAGDGTNRKYGEAVVEPDDLKRILMSIGDDREVRETTTLRSTLLTGNTTPHTDMKVQDGNKFDEDEEVMFVFLNDNEGAYFQIGEDKVPAKAGTVVSFKGNEMVHNTIVPAGSEVRLLGPIVSRDLCEITPSPTSSPTTNPTESPTKNPTKSPTKNPTDAFEGNEDAIPCYNPTPEEGDLNCLDQDLTTATCRLYWQTSRMGKNGLKCTLTCREEEFFENGNKPEKHKGPVLYNCMPFMPPPSTCLVTVDGNVQEANTCNNWDEYASQLTGFAGTTPGGEPINCPAPAP